MNPVFKDRVWALNVPPPWAIEDCGHCVQITQPKGVGAIHISCARKEAGSVSQREALAQLKKECPFTNRFAKVQCGEFSGYVGEYVDGATIWKKWMVACGRDLLFITYNCKRGDEQLEREHVSQLLRSLYSRA